MYVINFSHALTDIQQQSIGEILGYSVAQWWEVLQVRQVRFHANLNENFVPQVLDAVDRVGLTPKQWKESDIVVVLPSISTLAVLVLLEIHKRSGKYPPVVRIKKASATSDTYVVAEVINPQELLEQE